MTRMSIPKEYVLESPAGYKEYRFRAHVAACLSVTSFTKIYEGAGRLFQSFFITEEHKEVALDLLRYVMDVDDRATRTIITTRLIAALNEAGYFE